MADSLTCRRDGEDELRTVKPDTVHGGDCTPSKKNSSAEQGDEAQPPPTFQGFRRRSGKASSASASGSGGSGDPPEDPRRPRGNGFPIDGDTAEAVGERTLSGTERDNGAVAPP